MAVFLLSLHFKDNTMCVIEHISFNSVQVVIEQTDHFDPHLAKDLHQ